MVRLAKRLRVLVVLVVGLSLGLVACGSDQPPTATPTPPPVKAETKTDSLLADLLLKYRTGGLEALRQFARESGLLDASDRVRFGLTLDSSRSQPEVQAKLQQLGATITASYNERLAARVELSRLVQSTSQGNFWDELSGLAAVRDLKVMVEPPTGQVLSSNQQGIKVTGANRWQQLGFVGKGVRVGIIDSGFNGYQNYLGTALPSSGQVSFKSYIFNGGAGTERHGLEVADIIHSLAPEASLFMAAIEDEVGFAQAVDWLVANKVQIIQISLAWGGLWPSDGSSLLSRKLEEARAKGVLPVVSAGNYAQAHYSGTLNPDADGFHRFRSGEDSTVLKLTAENDSAWVSLRWDEDWNGPSTNLDLFVLNRDRQALGSSRNVQGAGSQKPPVELVPFHTVPGQTYYIQVRALSPVSKPGLHFDLFAYNATLEESDPAGSIATPGDAKGAITVGATSWQDDRLEDYSSRGPTTDGRGKPELVAPSGVQLQSLSNGQSFSGTSAAAPQVAGVAAIVWSVAPSLNADQVEKYLRRNAFSLGGATYGKGDPSTGYGRVQLGPVEAVRGGPSELLGAVATGTPQKDDFSDNRSGLPDNVMAYYGTLPSGSSAYFIRAGDPNELNWSVFSNRNYDEFKIEFTGGFPGQVPANGYFYGLVFWQRSLNDYYLLCISGDRFAVLQRHDQVWREIIPWGRDETLSPAHSSPRLSLEATAGYLRLKAGDTILQSISLENPQVGGKLGFAVGSFGFTGNFSAIPGVAVSPDPPLAMFSDMVITNLTSK